MRIAHLCLSNFYIDGRAYQENELIRQHVRKGHEVLVLASTESHLESGATVYLNPGEYVGSEGANVVRLPYRFVFNHFVSRKLRVHPGLRSRLEAFAPDVILFHGLCGWEMRTAAEYAERHPGTLLYADSHEDWNNSARGYLSREWLHRRYYRPVLQSALPRIRKILCISAEVREFVRDVYGVPERMLEFYPLGGVILPDAEYGRRREETRAAHGIEPGHVLFVQTGKLTARKLLPRTLRAFSAVPEPRFRLLIAGSLGEDVRAEAEALMAEDGRIGFLGWQDADDLTSLLCAADVYVQPGTQSVTMQASMCARCAVILDDAPSHRDYVTDNGWLVSDEKGLRQAFEAIRAEPSMVGRIGLRSYETARAILDYERLAERILT